MEDITLQISGMACGGCANTVRQALLALAGVEAAEVSHTEARADIRYDPVRVTPAQLRDAVSAAGYQVAG